MVDLVHGEKDGEAYIGSRKHFLGRYRSSHKQYVTRSTMEKVTII